VSDLYTFYVTASCVLELSRRLGRIYIVTDIISNRKLFVFINLSHCSWCCLVSHALSNNTRFPPHSNCSVQTGQGELLASRQGAIQRKLVATRATNPRAAIQYVSPSGLQTATPYSYPSRPPLPFPSAEFRLVSARQWYKEVKCNVRLHF
jgi:hypothetical protein